MKHVSLVAQSDNVALLPPDDLLRGAAAIAMFLLNDPKQRRAIYHMVEKGCLPVFRLRKRIYARKSTLSAWIEWLEEKQNERAQPAPPEVGGMISKP